MCARETQIRSQIIREETEPGQKTRKLIKKKYFEVKIEICRRKFWRKKFFGEENYDFAKIQDRMYEKHESYGVLKLSKQALQKGKVFIPVLEPDKTVLNRPE